MPMRFLLPIAILAFCTIFFSSSITKNQVAKNALVVVGDEVPTLPDSPYDYENDGFPEHLLMTNWGENDSTILDVVTNDGATLGRVLFYDEILSANENISCATCHKQERSFADDTRFSEGVNVDTRRNSMQLNDLGWTNRAGFFWDMSQHDLKDMVRLPLQDENEIGLTDLEGVINRMIATDYYPELFEKAFGSSTISMDRIQMALTQFISAMTTFNTKFDQVQRGDAFFTAAEETGFHIFEEACGMCHTDGQSFMLPIFNGNTNDALNSTPFLFANGLPIENNDIGAGEWSPEHEGLFKAPTLRNIEKTGPYMHDGRFENLEDVMKHYNEDAVEDGWGGVPAGGFQFGDEESDAIIAFLKTLSDDTFTTDVKFSNPFESGVVDVEKPNQELTTSVYPNPTNSWTAIYFENPSGRKAEIVVRNIQGQLIRKMSTNNSQLNIEVSQWGAGTYILTIKVGNLISEQKLSVN